MTTAQTRRSVILLARNTKSLVEMVSSSLLRGIFGTDRITKEKIRIEGLILLGFSTKIFSLLI